MYALRFYFYQSSQKSTKFEGNQALASLIQNVYFLETCKCKTYIYCTVITNQLIFYIHVHVYIIIDSKCLMQDLIGRASFSLRVQRNIN